MVDSTLGQSENVFALLCHHKSDCRVSDAGKHGLSLPDSQCSCGAVGASLSREVHSTHNIVTNAGDIFYGQVYQEGFFQTYGPAGTTVTPTNAFAEITVSEGVGAATAKTQTCGDMAATAITGKTQAFVAGYPQLSDPDSANNPGTTGADIITYRADYGTADANNAALAEVCIHVTGATFGSGTDPCLNRALFAATFAKTSADTMKIYVNHEFLGV